MAARDDLLAVAASLFAKKGYAATSTRQLTEALGTTTGGFYYHFDTKEDVLFEICEQALSRISEAVAPAIRSEEDPADRLASLIAAHANAMLSDQNLHKTMLTELRGLTGENYAAIRAARAAYARQIEELIGAAQRSGGLRSDIDEHSLTLVLLNMLNWTIFWYRRDGPLTPARFGWVVTRMFMEGAASDSQRARTKRRERLARRKAGESGADRDEGEG
jgi:AcrR family transcriptional regulator